MALEFIFRKDLANMIQAINQVGGGDPPDHLLKDVNEAQAEKIRLAYRCGFEAALGAVAIGAGRRLGGER